MKEHNHLLVEKPPYTQVEPLKLRMHPGLDTPPQEKQKKSSANRQFTTFLIGRILRCGVILSAGITLIGMLLLLLPPGGLSQQSLQLFPHTLGQVWIGLLAWQPQAIIALGLLLLIATPVVSVTASVVGFALEHDRRYVVIALIVLTALMTSFLLGKGG
jgi:uncharacterized membrane protein